MKRYIPLFYFYKKIVIPAIVISCIISLPVLQISGNTYLASIGVSYLFFLSLMHYFIYEVGKPNEYYFYYNLGFSKRFLWTTTVVSAIIIALTLHII